MPDNDLRQYLTQPEREEADALWWGLGLATANRVRMDELEAIATARKATHLGAPESGDSR